MMLVNIEIVLLRSIVERKESCEDAAKAVMALFKQIHVQTVGKCSWNEEFQDWVPMDGRHTSRFSSPSKEP